MDEVVISARIPQGLSEELTALGRTLRRDLSSVIEEALRRYIASERQFLAAIDEGLRDLEAGDLVDHAEAVEMMREQRRNLDPHRQ